MCVHMWPFTMKFNMLGFFYTFISCSLKGRLFEKEINFIPKQTTPFTQVELCFFGCSWCSLKIQLFMYAVHLHLCLGMCLGRSRSQLCSGLTRYTCVQETQRWLPLCAIDPRFSKCGSQTKSIIISQELINAESETPPQTHFDEIPSESYEKHCHRRISIICSFLFLPLAEPL